MNAKVIGYYEIDASKENELHIFNLIDQAVDEIHTIHKKSADSIVINARTLSRIGLPAIFKSHRDILYIVQSNEMPDNEIEVRGMCDNTYIIYRITNIIN